MLRTCAEVWVIINKSDVDLFNILFVKIVCYSGFNISWGIIQNQSKSFKEWRDLIIFCDNFALLFQPSHKPQQYN
jgi:hypothetical protein